MWKKISLIAVIVLSGISVYFVLIKQHNSSGQNNAQNTELPAYLINTNARAGYVFVQNNNYGYNFLLPVDWKISDNNQADDFSALDKVAIANPSETDLLKGAKLEITILSLQNGQSLKDRVNETLPNGANGDGFAVTSRTDATVDEKPAIRIKQERGKAAKIDSMFIQSGNNVIAVNMYTVMIDNYNEYLIIFSNIINSFKILK